MDSAINSVICTCTLLWARIAYIFAEIFYVSDLDGLADSEFQTTGDGSFTADLAGEEQAAEEVAVERFREVWAEEHLLGAAGIGLDVAHVGLEILVTVEVGGDRGRREAALGRGVPAGVNELQRLAVLHGESPVQRSDN
uniref:Uncharacterized protein n=1 Tax=Setaria viridis TaxID=4556 RepID=A0A4U6UDN0_SETVI|nr:hypothetical protein SEVIR_5G017400v2 [Setaria viridis]